MSRTDTAILAKLIRHVKADGEDPLTPLIDAYYIERKLSGRDRLAEYRLPLAERPRPPGRLSPSTIGGCQRQAVFRYTGVEGSYRTDPDVEAIFEDGNWRHHKLDALFYDMEKVLGRDRFRVVGIEKQVSIPNLYVAGTYDALVKIGGKLYLIDFKGINDYGFNWVFLNHRPRPEHVKQLITYCVARGIRRGVLLYENKNNNQRLVYVIRWTKEDWADVEKWINRVLMHLRRHTLPGRHPDCQKGTFLYEKCPFAQVCYGANKDSPERIRRLAFRNFAGIDEAWEAAMSGAA